LSSADWGNAGQITLSSGTAAVSKLRSIR
jgi:hypothetical protein